jgi:hypothetical protein
MRVAAVEICGGGMFWVVVQFGVGWAAESRGGLA